MVAGKEYIAEDPVHVVIASETPALYDTRGHMVAPKKRRVFAKFERGIAPPYAQKVALEMFEFRKIHQGIERERWFGYYSSRGACDEHGWDEDEHKLILARLAELGYVEVVPVAPAMPPAYDKLVVHGQRKIEHVVAKILERIDEGVYEPAAVLEWERYKLNRPDVIAAVEALAVTDEEPEPLVAA